MTTIASEIALKQMKEKEKFNKLPFDFYFEYNIIFKSDNPNVSNFGYAKLSKKLIAYYSLEAKELYILNDEKIATEIFSKFLDFLNKTTHLSKQEIKLKSGIIIREKWAKKIKYLFKKKPSIESTKNFLSNIFKEYNIIK